MPLFDEGALNELGLADLSPARREKLCQRMDYVLKLRVGEALLDAMSDDTLREIGLLLEEDAISEARARFDQAIGGCGDIVRAEQERIKTELRAGADRLRAADVNPVPRRSRPA